MIAVIFARQIIFSDTTFNDNPGWFCVDGDTETRRSKVDFFFIEV